MDLIIDCFVKFFLKQAEEIEPETIQALIDHGYRTKLSLTAMDLTTDLPLIEEVPLAQRSLLRKYIGALQESQPFSVTLSNEPAHSTSTLANERYQAVPIKKRKYDVFITDLNNSSWMDNRPMATAGTSGLYVQLDDVPYVPNKILRKKIIDLPSPSTSSRQTEPKTFLSSTQFGDISAAVWPDEVKPGDVNGLSQQPKPKEQQQAMECEDVSPGQDVQVDQVVAKKVKSTGGGGGGKKSSSAIVRTKSQIMHENMVRNLHASRIAAYIADNSVDSEQTETNKLNESTSQRGRGRKSSTAAVRTPSQIRYEKLRQRMSGLINDDDNHNNNEESTSEKASNTTVVVDQIAPEQQQKPEESQKVLTPAERAVLAKIEAKKKKEATTKTNNKTTVNRRRKRF